MAKLSYEDWKGLCAKFDPSIYHSKKASRKALGCLWMGFQNVKGQKGKFDSVRHNEMQEILNAVQAKHDARWGKW